MGNKVINEPVAQRESKAAQYRYQEKQPLVEQPRKGRSPVRVRPGSQKKMFKHGDLCLVRCQITRTPRNENQEPVAKNIESVLIKKGTVAEILGKSNVNYLATCYFTWIPELNIFALIYPDDLELSNGN